MTIAAPVGVALLMSAGMYLRRRRLRAMPDIGDEEFWRRV
jgi:hypothetical protein